MTGMEELWDGRLREPDGSRDGRDFGMIGFSVDTQSCKYPLYLSVNKHHTVLNV